MRIAICEDDVIMQNKLQDMIEAWAKNNSIKVIVQFFVSAEAFVMEGRDLPFDMIFLDIQMRQGGMTGIELAEEIRKNDQNVLIVFVTSHEQYAIAGYDVDALHYLLKSTLDVNLIPVLNKAKNILKAHPSLTLPALGENEPLNISCDSIFYISMNSHIATVYTTKGDFEVRITTSELLKKLPDYFDLCHRSYIVNLFKINYVSENTAFLINDTSVPVSRSNIKTVKDKFLRLHMR